MDRAVSERLEAHLPDGDPLARVEHIREPLAEAGDTPVDAAIVRESVEFDAHSRVIVGGAPEQRHDSLVPPPPARPCGFDTPDGPGLGYAPICRTSVATRSWPGVLSFL